MKDDLRSALNAVAAAQNKGRVPWEVLAHALQCLSELQAGQVGKLEAVIAREAALWPRFGPAAPAWRPIFDRSASSSLRAQPELAWLFIFHRDGHQREAALNLLVTAAPSPFLLAAVIWRLNDWVPQVRGAARRAFRRVMPASPLSAIVALAPFLVIQTRSWLRWDSEDAANIDQLLTRPDVVEALAQWLSTATNGRVAQTLQLMLRNDALDRFLPALAAGAILPTVRATALRTLIEERATWRIGFEIEWVDKVFGKSRPIPVLEHRPISRPGTWEEYVEQGLNDRAVSVRRIAADALSKSPRAFPRLREAVVEMASDPSSSIRARADFLLRQGC